MNLSDQIVKIASTIELSLLDEWANITSASKLSKIGFYKIASFIKEANINTELIKEIKHDEFIERHEYWSMNSDHSDKTLMISAYSKIDNGYIGELKQAKDLVNKFNMTQIQKSVNSHNVCSIAFCNGYKGKKGWAGWSHRAMQIFSIGDKLFNKKDYATMSDKTKFIDGGKITIESLDEAKQAAINFASYVS